VTRPTKPSADHGSPWQQALAILEKGRAGLALLARTPPIAPSPYDRVYRANKLQLLRYRIPPGVERRPGAPLVMVPSLINRHYILDLMPGRSLVEHLTARGFDVYMIDWGRPGPEDRFTSFDEYLTGLLDRSVRRAAQISGAPRASVLGYCMGGTFAAIHAALRPERVQSLIALAAPIDFSQAGLLGLWSAARYLDVDRLVDSLGNIPWPLLQATFHMLVPTLTAQKLLYLYDKVTDEGFADSFLSLETWGNDNVSFPGECFRRYLKDLYQQNLLCRGGLTVSGERVSLSRISCPVLNVVAQGDHIVPERSATPLSSLVGSKDSTLWLRPGGHIGAIVSRTASRDLWPALAAWLGERS
jgi:polyhydroxyalkanoate synthase